MIERLSTLILVAFLGALAVAVTASVQTPAGSSVVSDTVVDDTGAVVPGATVTLTGPRAS
jgi:hypothetical protein